LQAWSFPSANILFGDKKGAIGYWVLGALPIRPPHIESDGNKAYFAKSEADLWQGFIPFTFLPHVINPKRGYLISANHRPIQSFYPLNIGISTGSLGDTGRSWRLRERMEEKASFIPEEILNIHYDDVNPVKREILHLAYYMRDVQGVEFSANASNSLSYLTHWYKSGCQSDMDIPGTELANLIRPIFRMGRTELAAKYGGGNSGLVLFLKTAKQTLADQPEYEFPEEEVAFIQQTLETAWQTALRQYGNEPSNWPVRAQELIHHRTLGYYESLDGFPTLDPTYDLQFPLLDCIDGGTIRSQASQAYTQWVPLDDVDQALSLLPIGQDEHPDSPFRLVHYESWANGELHPAPITREAVEKYANRSLILAKPQNPEE
jgi:penicillin amidase